MPVQDVPTRSDETSERELPQSAFGAPHVFVLAAVEGPDAAAAHRVVQAETIVGRGDTADFRLADDEVSKRHLVLRVDGPVCTLMDLGSLNGTRLNGKKLRGHVAQRVRHLDEIHVGGTRLIVLAARFRRGPSNGQSSQ